MNLCLNVNLKQEHEKAVLCNQMSIGSSSLVLFKSLDFSLLFGRHWNSELGNAGISTCLHADTS